jgi:ADP-dependent NAD(P)H-hydrate dehydratase / NAD(P)H-hydrate epimerase
LTPLPDWLEPLYVAEEMRATDAWAIEERGIPGMDLMEAAGTALAREVAALRPDGPVAIVCGKGNNGGDGFVAARVLREAGREVRVLLAGDAEDIRGDAAQALARLGGHPEPFAATALEGAAVLVDALLGTGSSGAPRGAAAEATEAIGAAGAPVVATDVPSGVDASTGEVADVAVRADLTVTFHAAKPGLWITPGKEHAGEVRVVDIGIPAGGPAAPAIGLIGEDVLLGVPRRLAAGTKFSSGHVLVCGGSAGLTGAVVMAADAAMRAGAGYVTACVPASLNPIFEAKLTEVMTRPLPDGGGALLIDGERTVIDEAERRGGALVLGPGIGRAEPTEALVLTLAAKAPVPLVLDADGLNAHAGRLGGLAGRDAPALLTPHGGELGRLLGVESSEVNARRLHHAREAAQASGAIVVLKGDDTVVAEPEGRVAVSPGGAPALATAGTGDVLAGVLAALLAKGLDPFTAACAGVLLHVRAGRLAAERQGGPGGVIATDVIAALPASLHGP